MGISRSLGLAAGLAILGCSGSLATDDDAAGRVGDGGASATSDARTPGADDASLAVRSDGAAADPDATVGADGPRSTSDAGAPDGETVPIFVAQGMVGRTTISCDDGRTWIGDRSWDREDDPHLCGSTDIVCDAEGGSCGQRWYDGSCGTSSPCDCGHSPGFSKGVVFTGDQFVATWGWGWPGAVARSRNGIDWETTLDNQAFGGIAYGAGRVVLAARDNFWSTDGVTWNAGETADFSGPSEPIIWSVRRFGYADYDGGRFVAVASGNTDRDVLVSSDGGQTWWRPTTLPAECAQSVSTYGDILYGDGAIVIVDQDGIACRSSDGGVTWSSARIEGAEILSHGVWSGSEFWLWGDGNRYSSTDGATWRATPMTSPARIGPVARSETGTLAAVANVWSGYEQQEFLRSDDGGLTWTSLPAGAFAPGHPIFFVTAGRAAPSEDCR
jgi:hypothetical protein